MEKSTTYKTRSSLNPKTHNENQQPKFQEFLILTQARQHYSSQERVRKWQRESLQSAFQICGCDWGAGLAHPSQNEVYLCATSLPLVPDCLGSSLGLPPPHWDDDDKRCLSKDHMAEHETAITTYARKKNAYAPVVAHKWS